jgi:hypothetical protein
MEHRRRACPAAQGEYGDNLIALAVQASCARGEDTDYSDLELIAFLDTMPGKKPLEGLARIRDGMLIEVVCMTRKSTCAAARK